MTVALPQETRFALVLTVSGGEDTCSCRGREDLDFFVVYMAYDDMSSTLR